jgi:hypothetical protein
MRTRIDISAVRFRAQGVFPRQVSKNDKSQKTTGYRDPAGDRPIWTVRLSAFDTQENRSEQIFVEVAGPEPELAVDELVTVVNLTYVPWAAVVFNEEKKKHEGKVMRAFRADSIVMANAPGRRA